MGNILILIRHNFYSFHYIFTIFAVLKRKGRVAEWLGRGLQNLVQRFESASDLV